MDKLRLRNLEGVFNVCFSRSIPENVFFESAQNPFSRVHIDSHLLFLDSLDFFRARATLKTLLKLDEILKEFQFSSSFLFGWFR